MLGVLGICHVTQLAAVQEWLDVPCRGHHLRVQAPGDEQLHWLAQWLAWRQRAGAVEPPSVGIAHCIIPCPLLAVCVVLLGGLNVYTAMNLICYCCYLLIITYCLIVFFDWIALSL